MGRTAVGFCTLPQNEGLVVRLTGGGGGEELRAGDRRLGE